jgi:hypothetical protein
MHNNMLNDKQEAENDLLKNDDNEDTTITYHNLVEDEI